jgi:hypothetical protein
MLEKHQLQFPWIAHYICQECEEQNMILFLLTCLIQ